MSQRLELADLELVPESVVDPTGQLFYHQGRVLRAIHGTSTAEFYEFLLAQYWFVELFQETLIQTWIADDVAVKNVPLVLEHRRLPFDTHPAENTEAMHWQMAMSFIELATRLCQRGVFLKDAHPWNMMFDRGTPKFVDFGSLTQSEVDIGVWLNEFYVYFVVPIWLASGRWRRLSRQYRREHLAGFGIVLFQEPALKRWIWGKLFKLQRRGGGFDEILSEITVWLERHRPASSIQGRWHDYDQAHGMNSGLVPKTVKQRFVFDVIQQVQPKNVLDCAANNGFYAEMVAAGGADVVAFDYEEHCVDACWERASSGRLSITPVWMDFRNPTSRYGMGLSGRGAFERFRSELVLALGIIHHLCLSQRHPVQLFCDVCMRYCKRGVIVEYVDPRDEHVSGWDVKIPVDYTVDDITGYFQRGGYRLSRRKEIVQEGLRRDMLYFEQSEDPGPG